MPVIPSSPTEKVSFPIPRPHFTQNTPRLSRVELVEFSSGKAVNLSRPRDLTSYVPLIKWDKCAVPPSRGGLFNKRTEQPGHWETLAGGLGTELGETGDEFDEGAGDSDEDWFR